MLIVAVSFSVFYGGESVTWAQNVGGLELISGQRLATLTNDTDGDGIFDHRELLLGTNPQNSDTDGDGFDDFFEDSMRFFGFDPLVPDLDSDGDGLTDAFELQIGTNPFSPDTDNDGYTDFDEVLNARFGFDPLVPSVDTDLDGLTDSLEAAIGTAVNSPDTDGDGLGDFEEFAAGLNPRQFDPPGSTGELAGTTHSANMELALLAMRQGASFPVNLVGELPYPEIARRFYSQPQAAHPFNLVFRPSAALIKLSVFRAYYQSYNTIVKRLAGIAAQFNGGAKPDIARLFCYLEPTSEKRMIYMLKLSDNPEVNEDEPEMLFLAMHHARELVTTSIILGLIKELTDRYAAGDSAIRGVVDNTELWFVPVVNPDGYAMAMGELDKGAGVGWRKNTRHVSELTPAGRMQDWASRGVDPNRNYGFEHISTIPFVLRDTLRDDDKSGNGVDVGGSLQPNLDTYAGAGPFTEVETRAVRFLTEDRDRVNGFSCSLSWHTYGGQVAYPMGHATVNGLRETDRPVFDALSSAYATTAVYANTKDRWGVDNYYTWGDSDDWLYKEKGVFSILVEAYSPAERGARCTDFDPTAGPCFFPDTLIKQTQVVSNNVRAALALINTCYFISRPPIIRVPDWGSGILHLSFDTRAGATYFLEGKNSLSAQTWTVLQQAAGTGQTVTFTDQTSPNLQARFYRLRVEY